MHKILIIADSPNRNWNKVFYKLNRNDHFTLHSININTESVLNVIRTYPKYRALRISKIDPNKISQQAEKEARDYYLNFISNPMI